MLVTLLLVKSLLVLEEQLIETERSRKKDLRTFWQGPRRTSCNEEDFEIFSLYASRRECSCDRKIVTSQHGRSTVVYLSTHHPTTEIRKPQLAQNKVVFCEEDGRSRCYRRQVNIEEKKNKK
ncbi:protein kinase subdomain-containing protein pkl/ccin9 [Gigaspora margarita]|uniref:Protein kinase subdomain-containing protein pkl/ccin9 n=1 Tax=Gigaspora margarita TaxID=4874 RepID=A0A8H3X0N0_GIGMA|nr:protein kinase subdomain-containing protein pkl/ccin9 [Gigaspora margarita]